MLHLTIRGSHQHPALVLLHGFLGSSDDWLELADQLQPEFLVIMPDLPGHGKSIHLPTHMYGFSGFSEQLRLQLKSLNIHRFFLAGYSMGGRLALYLTIRFPKLMDKLLLVSSSPGLQNVAERRQRQKKDLAWINLLRETSLQDFLSIWYEQPLFSYFIQHPHFQRILARRLKNAPQELVLALRYLGTGWQYPLWEELEKIHQSVCLIVGESDHKYVELAKSVCLHLSHGQLSIIPNSGHVVYEEQPVLFLEALKSFLR